MRPAASSLSSKTKLSPADKAESTSAVPRYRGTVTSKPQPVVSQQPSKFGQP